MNLRTYFKIMGFGSKSALAKEIGVGALTITRWLKGSSLPDLERRIDIYKATHKHVDSWPDWKGTKAKMYRDILRRAGGPL